MDSYPDHLSAEDHKWLQSQGVRSIVGAVRAGGGTVRVVGGAVRDALLGREVHDIDFAVNLPPQAVGELLSRAGIKVVPTGIAHGTVTAVVDHKGYEITTLRHDLETDGRHAKVAFTTDWHADAARRDFTFNAMYLDEEGAIIDHFDGRGDLAARCIRFIGDPRERIEEDVLRILRAFRFMAQIGTAEHPASIESKSLQACQELAPLIKTLSAERGWHEFSRLLSVDNPLPACRLMMEVGVFQSFLPQVKTLVRLEGLLLVENGAVRPCPIRRLASLVDGEWGEASKQLKLSRKEKEKLGHLCHCIFAPAETLSLFVLRQKLYDFGVEITRDAMLLHAIDRSIPVREFLKHIEGWKKPTFPLSGKEMKKLGVLQGPEMGALLKRIELWWRSKDFTPSKEECINEARLHILKA